MLSRGVVSIGDGHHGFPEPLCTVEQRPKPHFDDWVHKRQVHHRVEMSMHLGWLERLWSTV